MSFYARNFVYDDIPSENYNITISTNAEETYNGSSNVEIYSESIYRKPKVYLYGTSQRPVLQFPVTVNTPEELDSEDVGIISRWLFGRKKYAKLQIVQPDMEYIYYNCLLTNPKTIKVGAIIRGISCDVVCDSPFAWEYPQTTTFNFSTEYVGQGIDIYNLSDDTGYLYPSMTFTGNSIGGSVSFMNLNDSLRTFTYSNLLSGEVITVNNELQQISTSRGVKILSNFNKKWMRLVAGRNNIAITGNISTVSFTYQFARKMT